MYVQNEMPLLGHNHHTAALTVNILWILGNIQWFELCRHVGTSNLEILD